MTRGKRRSQLSRLTRSVQGPISRVIRTSDAGERVAQSNLAESSNRQGSGLFSSANNVGIYGGSMISAAGNITIVHAPENENTSAEVRNSEVNTAENNPVRETESPLSAPVRRPHPQRSCEVYYRNLVMKRRGSPLWIPEPSYNLPIQYQRKGVSIGDVGVLSASGSFTFFFNICLPSDHPINLMGVPEGFHPVSPPLIHHDIQTVQEFNADSYIASESIETSRRRHSDSSASDLIFESSAEQGAVLTMPHGARSEDLVNTLRFRAYVAKNIENWYRYIIGVRGCEATNGDVRLVIGCDKTDLWGMASFVKSTETVRLRYQPISVGQSYKWEYSGSFDTRTGPEPAVVERLQQSSDDRPAGEETANNQCLFVRTLNANLHANVWKDIALKIYSDMGIDFEELAKGQTHEPSVIMQTGSLITASGGSRGSSLVDHVEEGKAATGRHHSFEESSLLKNSNVSMAMMQHPSNAINELLWEYLHGRYPTAKVIITEDSDWINVLRSDDGATLPNANELYRRIIEQGTEVNVDEDHDSISLRFPSDQLMSDQVNENLFDEPAYLFPMGDDEYENRFSDLPHPSMTNYFGTPYSPMSPAATAEMGFSYHSSHSRPNSRASSRHSLGDCTNSYDNQASPMRSRSTSRRRDSDNEDAERGERKSRVEITQHEQQMRDKLREGYKKLMHVLPASDKKTSKVSVLDRAAERIATLQKEIKALESQSGDLDSESERLQVAIDSANCGV